MTKYLFKGEFMTKRISKKYCVIGAGHGGQAGHGANPAQVAVR